MFRLKGRGGKKRETAQSPGPTQFKQKKDGCNFSVTGQRWATSSDIFQEQPRHYIFLPASAGENFNRVTWF